MLRNKILLAAVAGACMMLASCIKEYVPELNPADVNKIVVYGQITDVEGMQTVNISMASSVTAPKYMPLKGCVVTVIDDKGNTFPLPAVAPGVYSAWMDKSFLNTGTGYKLKITTATGENIESGFEVMPSCPDVDNVYYMPVSEPTLLPGEAKNGIRFYLDVNGRNSDSRYYRWELTETWEYHVPYDLEWYYDGTVHHVYPPDASKRVCWKTEMVNDFYSLSTASLAANSYKSMPLHFIDNSTQRLAYIYSLLVDQYAITEKAYNYLDKVKKNSNNTGGLYMKQPIAIRGNLVNTSHPERTVLGYFGAASVRSKRIFVKNGPGLPQKFENYCNAWVIERGFFEFTEYDYPVYLKDRNGEHKTYSMVQLDANCIDCQLQGGKTVKPDYWPE